MRTPIRGILAFTCLAALTLANTANAGPIMSFTQAGDGTVTGTTASGTTTLTTNSALFPGSKTVTIGTIGTGATNIAALETFSLVRSTAAASIVNGQIQQDAYTGTITFTNPVGGAVLLTVTLTGTGDFLNGGPGTGSAGLNGPMTFTAPATSPIVIAGALGGPGVTSATGSGSLSFSNIVSPPGSTTNGLILTGTTLNNFAASLDAGNFTANAAVPEPASIVMASMAVVAGLGLHGLRRKGTQA
jgi:hypothetical protein